MRTKEYDLPAGGENETFSIRLCKGPKTDQVANALRKYRVTTVCKHGACPNSSECWGRGHFTVMVAGSACTRNCRFCNVGSSVPEKLDPGEPLRVAYLVKSLSLEYVVITSVTRDDLSDEGAGHISRTVEAVLSENPDAAVELLIPDFSGRSDLLSEVLSSGADVIGHNIELPEALYPEVRPQADYSRSLEVLGYLARRKSEYSFFLKSSMMLGLGESKRDIVKTFEDLFRRGVDMLYLGQYLAPSPKHYPVKKRYSRREFLEFERIAMEMGFKLVFSGALVRSSYKALESFRELSCAA